MSTARDFLAAVQQRADAAIDGRWVYGGQGWVFAQAVSIGDGELRDLLAQVRTNDADAEFIAASRTDVPRLVAALEAVLDAHEPVNALLNPGPHERVVKVCTGCGTDDGNWQRWPCPTVRAITSALTPKENNS